MVTVGMCQARCLTGKSSCVLQEESQVKATRPQKPSASPGKSKAGKASGSKTKNAEAGKLKSTGIAGAAVSAPAHQPEAINAANRAPEDDGARTSLIQDGQKHLPQHVGAPAISAAQGLKPRMSGVSKVHHNAYQRLTSRVIDIPSASEDRGLSLDERF